MNERIKDLWWKARIGYNEQNCDPEVLENFAQLIAQESIVDFYRRYLDICSEEDITVQVERYVKEHFGVE